ncbi:MAG: ABC transporter substrate-binding protein [Pseudomonadota bacterium]
MKKYRYRIHDRLFILLGSLILLISASDKSVAKESLFPVVVMDGIGREVHINKIPERIISTVPSNTEILYDLGLKDRVIAVTSHCLLTCDVKGKEIMKGWANMDVGKIVSLKPDLVLAFGGLQVPLVDKLDRLGIPVFGFYPRTVAETLSILKTVGQITGTEEKAVELLKAARAKLENVRERLRHIPPDKQRRFLRLISPKDIIVAGRYSFQHDILVQAGGDNIMKGLLRDYERVKFKQIKALNPEVIILNGDNEQEVKEKFLRLEGWKDLQASKQKQVKVMPCRLICHPNFYIVDVVENLAQYLYPDLFK